MIGQFLAKMCKIIQAHGGDVDCFAGDALLVVFPAGCPGATASGERGGGSRSIGSTPVVVNIAKAVASAVECATCISKELNGFQASPNHPTLGIHAALSAGHIMHVEGGKLRAVCAAA